jgi:hypothetical protein
MEDNHKMDTLSECMIILRERGYNKEFEVKSGMLCCKDCENTYNPQEVKIPQFYRFEGESDPGDMQVLYAIECADGAKGMLVDGFGVSSSEEVNEFVKKVNDIHKINAY